MHVSPSSEASILLSLLWMLEDSKKLRGRLHHNLDVLSYDEPQVKPFFLPQNWYGHAHIARTIAAGPGNL